MLMLSRSSFIPKNSREERDEQTGAVVYLYEAAGALYALGFHGKAQRPDWHYRFRSDEARRQKIADHFLVFRAAAERKAARRVERSTFRHAYKVGDVLVSSWGYDQTNIDFFQVVALKGAHQVVIRKIAGESVPGPGVAPMSGYVTARPGEFIGEEMVKRVQFDGSGGYVSMSSYASAYPWDGRPRYESWYA